MIVIHHLLHNSKGSTRLPTYPLARIENQNTHLHTECNGSNRIISFSLALQVVCTEIVRLRGCMSSVLPCWARCVFYIYITQNSHSLRLELTESTICYDTNSLPLLVEPAGSANCFPPAMQRDDPEIGMQSCSSEKFSLPDRDDDHRRFSRFLLEWLTWSRPGETAILSQWLTFVTFCHNTFEMHQTEFISSLIVSRARWQCFRFNDFSFSLSVCA